VPQLGRGCEGALGTGGSATGWQRLGTHGLTEPKEGHGEEVGGGFGDQMTILCVSGPLTGTFILSLQS